MTDAPDIGADGPAALARIARDTTPPGTRRIVARTVASEPLDHYAAIGALSDDAYEAGKRLRALLASTWPAARCTARAAYVSAGSEHDEEQEPEDEDARWQARTAAWDQVREAERAIGRDNWPTVRAVCEGYWLGRMGEPARLVVGLRVLAVWWGR